MFTKMSNCQAIRINVFDVQNTHFCGSKRFVSKLRILVRNRVDIDQFPSVLFDGKSNKNNSFRPAHCIVTTLSLTIVINEFAINQWKSGRNGNRNQIRKPQNPIVAPTSAQVHILATIAALMPYVRPHSLRPQIQDHDRMQA